MSEGHYREQDGVGMGHCCDAGWCAHHQGSGIR